MLWLCCQAIILSRCFHCWRSQGILTRMITPRNFWRHQPCACHQMTVHWMFHASEKLSKNKLSEYSVIKTKIVFILKIPLLFGACTPIRVGSKSLPACGEKLALRGNGNCCHRCRRRFKSNHVFFQTNMNRCALDGLRRRWLTSRGGRRHSVTRTRTWHCKFTLDNALVPGMFDCTF